MHTQSHAHITTLVCDLLHFALTSKKKSWISFYTNDTYLCVSLTELNGDSTETEKWQLFAIHLYVSILFTALAAVCACVRESANTFSMLTWRRERDSVDVHCTESVVAAVWRNQCSIHWNRSLSVSGTAVSRTYIFAFLWLSLENFDTSIARNEGHLFSCFIENSQLSGIRVHGTRKSVFCL